MAKDLQKLKRYRQISEILAAEAPLGIFDISDAEAEELWTWVQRQIDALISNPDAKEPAE